MAALLVICVLAACGVLSILWAAFGFLLPGQRGVVMVCLDGRGKEEAVIRRDGWLHGLGLVRGPLVLIDQGLSEQERERLLRMELNVVICTWEGLPSILEQERERLG